MDNHVCLSFVIHRHSKQRVIYEGVHPISGLYFKPQQAQGRSVVLYVTTEHHVMAITIGAKEKDTNMVREMVKVI